MLPPSNLDPKRGSMGKQSPAVSYAEVRAALAALHSDMSEVFETEVLAQYWPNETFLLTGKPLAQRQFLASCLSNLKRRVFRYEIRDMEQEAVELIVGRPHNLHLMAGDFIRGMGNLHRATRENKPWSYWYVQLCWLYLSNHIAHEFRTEED